MEAQINDKIVSETLGFINNFEKYHESMNGLVIEMAGPERQKMDYDYNKNPLARKSIFEAIILDCDKLSKDTDRLRKLCLKGIDNAKKESKIR